MCPYWRSLWCWAWRCCHDWMVGLHTDKACLQKFISLSSQRQRVQPNCYIVRQHACMPARLAAAAKPEHALLLMQQLQCQGECRACCSCMLAMQAVSSFLCNVGALSHQHAAVQALMHRHHHPHRHQQIVCNSLVRPPSSICLWQRALSCW